MDRLEHLRALEEALNGASLDLPTPRAGFAEQIRARASRRLADHVIPRLESVGGPLLAVVGGSTGAGKSTIVNSLVGAQVSASSALRPTTRRPLLLHHAADGPWFERARLLPELARLRAAPGAPATTGAAASAELEMRESEALPEGVSLLDAPDLDSVVDSNRMLARGLFDAADLWVFVTTAARYADAVPWEVLSQAPGRDLTVGVVLNRLPPGAATDVAADLRRLMAGAGLGEAPLFTVDEQPLASGLLPGAAVAGLRRWLEGIGADARRRAEIAHQSLTGAVREVAASVGDVEEALAEHDAALAAAADALDTQVDRAAERVSQATADGTLLRGEVLARWQEVVGAADFTRRLGSGVSWLRDRVSAALRGRPAPVRPVEDAIEAGLASLVREELSRVREDAESAWESMPAVAGLVDAAEEDRASLDERALGLTREWQRDLLALVREQGASRRAGARLMAVGVNVVGVALMIVIFASTGGITGAEVGVAGATAAVAQRLLEAVFGDQAVRTMAGRARALLLDRVRGVLEESVRPLRDRLPEPSAVADLAGRRGEVQDDWGLR
ncbi:dynamin family protein [Schaalia naturae]|uniref:Dynamin family protein n=1 Tax=Schaalia naturae TaxID=635203 RepID=A0ABW2SJU1_9ACTO